MGLEAAGEKLFEDGGVLADELDGAEGEIDGVFDEGSGEGLGRFEFDEVFEVYQWLQILLPLHGVVEASVSDELEGAVEYGSPLGQEARVRGGGGGGGGSGDEGGDEPHCSGFRGCCSLLLFC